MPEAESSTPVPDLPLDHDHPCQGCGYNLRGLGRSGACPECGESIARSLTNQLLAGADPAWVLRVYRGADLILWAVLMTVFLPFGGACFLSIAGENGWPWRITAWVIVAWLAVGWFLAALGTWLITTPTKDRQNPYPHPALRWTATLGITVGPALLMLFLLGQIYAGPRMPNYHILFLIFFGGTMLLGIGKTALYLCYRQLAQRMKNPNLARSAGLLAGLIALGTFIFFLLLLPEVTDAHGSIFNDHGKFLACSLPFIILIAMIWQLALAAAFRSKLRQALPHRFYPKHENNFGAGAM